MNQELKTTIDDERNLHRQECHSLHDQCWEVLYGPNRLSPVRDFDEESEEEQLTLGKLKKKEDEVKKLKKELARSMLQHRRLSARRLTALNKRWKQLRTTNETAEKWARLAIRF